MDLTAPPATWAKPKSAQSTHSLLARATKAEVKKIVAARLLSARELNGLSQTEAARKLGYATPAQLSLWEQCRRMPPMQMLVRASSVYRVSLDFLMGVSPEPDRDPMSATRRYVLDSSREMMNEMACTLADAVIDQTQAGGPTVEVAYLMLSEGERFVAAFRRFVEINGNKFENMRGSAPFKTFAESFEANCLEAARGQVGRYSRINSKAVKATLKKIRPIRDIDLFNHIEP